MKWIVAAMGGGGGEGGTTKWKSNFKILFSEILHYYDIDILVTNEDIYCVTLITLCQDFNATFYIYVKQKHDVKFCANFGLICRISTTALAGLWQI